MGSTVVFGVRALDASGAGLGGVPVAVRVTGVHARDLAGVTDVSGRARFEFVGALLGDDVVHASAGGVEAEVEGFAWSEAIVIASPVNKTVSGVVPLAASFVDSLVPSRLDVLVDSAGIGTLTAAPWTVSWDSRTVADGRHILVIRATINGIVTSKTVDLWTVNKFTVLGLLTSEARAGRLNADQFVRLAVQYLVGGDLPDNYYALVPAGYVENADVSSSLFELMSLPISAATRGELDAMFASLKANPDDYPETDVDPPSAPAAGAAPGSVVARAVAKASPFALAAVRTDPPVGVTPPRGCVAKVSDSGAYWECSYVKVLKNTLNEPLRVTVRKDGAVTGDVLVPKLIVKYYRYNHPDAFDETKVADVLCFTARPAPCANGTPDLVDQLARGAFDSLKTYLGMGLELNAPAQVAVEIDLRNDTRVTLPVPPHVRLGAGTAWSSPGGTIFYPLDESRLTVRHEVAHQFQWSYVRTNRSNILATFLDYVGQFAWWSEATAEWMDHQTVDRECPPANAPGAPSVGLIGPLACVEDPRQVGVDFYTRNVGRYLAADPLNRRLNLAFLHGYEHVLLAEWLEEIVRADGTHVGVDAIRHTFETIKHSDADAQQAITDEVTATGKTFDVFINEFWTAAYALDNTTVTPRFTDPHASKWRALLTNTGGDLCGVACAGDSFSPLNRAARDRVSLERGTATTSSREILLGGAQFYDISAPQLPATYRINIQAIQPRAVASRLVSWSNSGYPDTTGCTTQYSGLTNGSATMLVTLTNECPKATLVLTSASPGGPVQPGCNPGDGIIVDGCKDYNVNVTLSRPKSLNLALSFQQTVLLDPLLERVDATVSAPDCNNPIGDPEYLWQLYNGAKLEVTGNGQFIQGAPVWRWFTPPLRCLAQSIAFKITNPTPTTNTAPWLITVYYRDICC